MHLPEIDVEELERRLVGGASVVDVREHDEWASLRIANTRLIPLATIPEHVDEIRGDDTVYVVTSFTADWAKANAEKFQKVDDPKDKVDENAKDKKKGDDKSEKKDAPKTKGKAADAPKPKAPKAPAPKPEGK